jgi:hypothetical protein
MKGDTDLCHLTTVPEWPERVSKPLVVPEHMVVPPVTLPPTDIGSTDTVVEEEFAGAQTPLWTTARNCVFWVKGPEVYIVEVFVISDHALKGDTELCHLTTVPV